MDPPRPSAFARLSYEIGGRMNLRNNQTLREQLSAEYVLGTLKNGARRRFEGWLKNDAALRSTVAQWQDRLHPMGEFVPAVQPPPSVWRAIEQRLHLQGRPSFRFGWRNDLQFWRGLAIASTALACMLVIVLLVRDMNPGVPSPIYVATLSDDKSQPIVVVTGDFRHRQLTVKVLTKQNIAADKSLELWAVPKVGHPRSLGLLAANGSIVLQVPENVTPQSVAMLAVSLEPIGGSPSPDGPTGPIVLKGAWVAL